MYSTNQHVYSSMRSGNNCNVRGQLKKSYRHAHTLTYSQQTRSSPFSSSKTNDATVAVRVYREQNPTTLVWQHLNARWFTHSHLKPIVYQNHACIVARFAEKNLQPMQLKRHATENFCFIWDMATSSFSADKNRKQRTVSKQRLCHILINLQLLFTHSTLNVSVVLTPSEANW